MPVALYGYMAKTALVPLTALLFSLSASAKHLQPIVFRLPLDPSIIENICNTAFEQAFKDKEESEKQPLKVKCTYNLKFDAKESLRSRFMIHCRQVVELQAAKGTDETGNVKIDPSVPSGSFADSWEYVKDRACLDQATKKFNEDQSREESASGQYNNDVCNSSFYGCP